MVRPVGAWWRCGCRISPTLARMDHKAVLCPFARRSRLLETSGGLHCFSRPQVESCMSDEHEKARDRGKGMNDLKDGNESRSAGEPSKPVAPNPRDAEEAHDEFEQDARDRDE